MNPPWLTLAGASLRRSRWFYRPHLEPLEERLPPGETWSLLASSWWGLDLASLSASAGVLENPGAAVPVQPAFPVAWRAAGDEGESLEPVLPHALAHAPVAPISHTDTDVSGLIRSESRLLSAGPTDPFRSDGPDFPAGTVALNVWEASQGGRSFHRLIGSDESARPAPVEVGTGSAAAPAPLTVLGQAGPEAHGQPVAPIILGPGLGGHPRGPGNSPPPPGGAPLSLIGYSLGTPVLDQRSLGDTWGPAWSLDNQLYTASDDSTGFDNAYPSGYDIISNRLTGDPNQGNLHGVSLAGLSEYGPMEEGCNYDDGCNNWKATNMTSVNGVLYLGITITSYIDRGSLQPQMNASIIKSDNADGHGLGHTWAPTHTYTNDPMTMWPDTPAFSAPYFVDYGQDPGPAGDSSWPDAADQYVYAVSTDGAVRNASNLYLGRVARDQIGNLQAEDWNFVTGFDTQGNPTWGSVGSATPVLGVLHGDNTAGRLGWTTAEWVAPIQKYILTEWYYPNPRAECPDAPAGSCQNTSRWVMYQADHVWGPWQQFGPEFTWAPGHPSSETEGDYFPVVPTKFMDTQIDMSVYPYQLHTWVLTTGNFHQYDTMYKLTAVPLTLEVIPTPNLPRSLMPAGRLHKSH